MRATALTSSLYLASVNRPIPEMDVPLGGPSVLVGPDGDVLLETTETIALARLDRSRIDRARRAYPGYLPQRARLYAAAWHRLADPGSSPPEA